MERINAITPDKIWGSNFRIPQITGEGSGKGFNFKGLHLPSNWEKATTYKDIDPQRFQHFFERTCAEFKLDPGVVRFDPQSRVLESISIKTKPISYLKLDREFPNEEDGIYCAQDLNDLKAAIVLQRVAGAWLANLWEDIDPNLTRSYGLIDGEPGRFYYSNNLTIPKLFLASEQPITTDHFQNTFRLTASNIAGRFGLTLRSMHFDKQGLLRDYDIREGNACGYYLKPDQLRDGQYYNHNVDTPYQVATLHGIGASFINYLLEQKEMLEEKSNDENGGV